MTKEELYSRIEEMLETGELNIVAMVEKDENYKSEEFPNEIRLKSNISVLVEGNRLLLNMDDELFI